MQIFAQPGLFVREGREAVKDSLRVETVATLAERLDMTRETIVQEVVEGRLRYVNVGGHWRFREQDIDHWLEHHGRSRRFQLVDGERSA